MKQGQSERVATLRFCPSLFHCESWPGPIGEILHFQLALYAITLLGSNRYHNTDLSNMIQKLVTDI